MCQQLISSFSKETDTRSVQVIYYYHCPANPVIVLLCSFLREPWSLAIYHDRFSDLQQEIVELLRTPLVSIPCFLHHMILVTHPL